MGYIAWKASAGVFKLFTMPIWIIPYALHKSSQHRQRVQLKRKLRRL